MKNEINEIRESGFSIIPVLGDKKPALSWKQYQENPATSQKVDGWADEYKAFAIVTGKVSDCFVLDFDGEEGLETLKMLGIEPHVVTPGGGFHAYFNYPAGVKRITTVNTTKDSLNEKYPSMDSRGDGGYAIFYGSTDNGEYQHLKKFSRENFYDIDVLPLDLQDILTCKSVEKKSINSSFKATVTSRYKLTPSVNQQTEEIPSDDLEDGVIISEKPKRVPSEKIQALYRDHTKFGGRNNAMLHFACQLRDNYYTPQETYSIISKYADTLPVTDAHDCVDPIDFAEITNTVNSAFSREKRKPWDTIEENKLNERCSDTGNAETFASNNKNKLKSVISAKKPDWYIWNGKTWEEDKINLIVSLVKDEVKSWYSKIPDLTDASDRNKFSKHITKSLNKTNIDNMLFLAGCSSELTCPKDIFDKNNFLLNCKNGTLNLETKELYSHKMTDYMTKLLSVDYNPDSKCPLFLKFLDEIFCRDTDLIQYIQKMLGYCITGEIKEQCFWIFVGGGSNGKSTLLDLIRDILGEYAVVQPADMLTLDRFGNSKSTYDISLLEGKRLAIASETQESLQFNEQKVKNLTECIITARDLYKSYRPIRLTHKLILACNHLPTIKGQDKGIWRRVKVIPFNATFGEAKKTPPVAIGSAIKLDFDKVLPIDKDLSKKFKAEYEGVLAWIVEGCYRYIAEGLADCKSITQSIEAYKAEMDLIADFIVEKCNTEKAGAAVKSSLLYKAYSDWCSENGNRYALSQTSFSKQMVDKGFDKKRTKTGAVWIGIEIRL